MSEHPLLFTTEMVRATLDGRKTQTRRVPIERYRNWKVGDTLWVRENVRTLVCQRNNKTWKYGEFEIEYIADRTIIRCPDEHEKWWRYNWQKRPATTIPSIHMPKWAARIFLEITGLRVERVQDICASDAIEEGIECRCDVGRSEFDQCHLTAAEHFAILWDSINAKRHKGIYAWDKNPEVKVIEFKKIKI